MRRAFKNPGTVFAFIALTLVLYALVMWFPNASLIIFILSHETVAETLRILAPLLGNSLFDAPLNSLLFSFMFSFLVSLNIVLLSFLIRMNQSSQKISWTTFGGFIAGVFGLGCAACGSIFLTSGTLFFGGILVALPFHGLEIGYAGLLLLAFSAYKTNRYINSATC